MINGSINKSNHCEKDRFENLIGKNNSECDHDRKQMANKDDVSGQEKVNKTDVNEITLPEFGDDTDDPISNFEISSQQN